jgi:hypothetical protein
LVRRWHQENSAVARMEREARNPGRVSPDCGA